MPRSSRASSEAPGQGIVEVAFKLRNAPNGHYTTTVVDLSKAGAIHDSAADAADPGFTK